jgi:hypothetical protein
MVARHLAEHATTPELAGYRGWWWYLAALAGRLSGNEKAEIECLWRCSKAGVYTGLAAHLLAERKAVTAISSAYAISPNVEAIWDTVNRWGWAGPSFEKKIDSMLTFLKSDEPTKFHQGMELLGQCLGSAAIRSTEPGAPDAVWPFPNGYCFCFEAKTEKKIDGAIYKKDLEEPKMHPEWVKHYFKFKDYEFPVVMVSPTVTLDKVAEAFAAGVFYLSPDEIRAWASDVAEALRKVRATFAGSDYSEREKEFAAEVVATKLDFDTVKGILTKKNLV